MRVVMIEPIGYSGIRYYTEQLSRQLVDLGVDLALITSRHYERLPTPPPYRVYPVMGGMDRTQDRLRRGVDYALRQLKVADVVHIERPNLIHMQDMLVGPVDLLWLRWLRYRAFPIIYTVHDADRSIIRYTRRLHIVLNRAVAKQIYHLVDRLIVHTQSDRNKLVNLFGVPPERITQIAHGNHSLQLEGLEIPSQSVSRIRLGLPLDAPVGLFFGERRYSKGLDLLIKALPEVITVLPHFRLIIAGEAQIANKVDYEAMSRRYGVRDHILFVDRFIPIEEVPWYFAACDVVLLPYRSISQSGVLHLAFSLSRPVIASKIGGLAEVVEEGETGLFVEQVEDHKELASKIIYAAQRRDWLAELGWRAFQRAQSRFAWNVIARKTLELYKTVLQRDACSSR